MTAKTTLIARNKKKQKVLVSVSNAKTTLKGSVEKVNRALNIIRGMSLQEAMNFLYFSRYACAAPIAKLLKSAAANALHNNPALVQDLKDLHISQIWSSPAFKLRRWKSAPRGRARPIQKQYSHVYLELAILGS